MRTMLLDTAEWDLVLNAAGNIAIAETPYAYAQDVASAVRTFAGEVFYNDTLGVPYFEKFLGQPLPLVVFQDAIVTAALTVPGVVDAVCQVTGVNTRELTGQVLFTDETGATQLVGIT